MRHGPPRIEAIHDRSPVAWLAARLWPWHGATKVGNLIPEGFAAYARLLHPAYHPQGQDVPWARVAEWSGKTLRPTIAFDDLATREDGATWSSTGGSRPREELDPAVCGHLATVLRAFTSTPELSWFCIWTGYGDLVLEQLQIEITPGFTSSGRTYYVWRGPVDAVTELEFPFPDPTWLREHSRHGKKSPYVSAAIIEVDEADDGAREPITVFHSPNFWWPEDRAWFVSTEIDGYSTYIGGSTNLVDRLLGDPNLEVEPADPRDPFEGAS